MVAIQTCVFFKFICTKDVVNICIHAWLKFKIQLCSFAQLSNQKTYRENVYLTQVFNKRNQPKS